MAAASPARSGDELAGLAAESRAARVAARSILADLPLSQFLQDALVPYEQDEVTRLIIDSHDAAAFASIAHLTVGGLRDWLLHEGTGSADLAAVSRGLTPEMVAAVSKLMRAQDLIAVARKVRVVTAFRNTIGLPGRLSTRLQPNHPSDDPRGIAAAVLDGLLYGVGDAVIGINPATDSVPAATALIQMLDELRERYAIPTQSCVLTHVTNAIQIMERGAPVDLVFQSVAGCNFLICVPGSDDIMLSYQSLSYHDALYLRSAMGVRAAPEFETWLAKVGIAAPDGTMRALVDGASPFVRKLAESLP